MTMPSLTDSFEQSRALKRLSNASDSSPLTRFERIQTILGIVQVIVVVVSTGLVVQQLRQAKNQLQEASVARKTTVELERRARSMDFIKRFNSETIITIRAKAADAVRSGSFSSIPGNHDLTAYLNFFEEMALAVENDLAEPTICYLFFRSPMTYLCNRCKPFLDSNQNTYLHVKALLEKWKTEPKKVTPL